MRAKFIGSGDPTDSAICEVFGHTFPKGEWVEITGDAVRLANNPVFEVEGAAPAAPEALTPDERAAVEIPDDWAGRSWQERRSLASKLSDDPIKDGDGAAYAIKAELARRAENQA